MEDKLFTAHETAQRLGITVTTLYDWLGQSDRGLLVIRGQRGQGRIKIEAKEAERIRELMRVRPQNVRSVRRPILRHTYPGITVPLGRPDNVP